MNKFALSFTALVCLCSCKFNASSLLHQNKEKYPVKVKVMTAMPSSSVSRNVFIGETIPAKTANLTAPYPGTLRNIAVNKGSIVKEGDLLATISSQQVESACRMAEADFEQADDAMKRIQKVYATGSVSEVQMTDIRTKLDKAKAALEAAEHSKEQCSVKAPYRAVVSEIFPSEGEYLSLEDRIMTLLDISDLKIEISVHENEIGNIRRGMKAKVEIPALGVQGVEARVTEKDIYASKLTRSYKCGLKLSSIPGGLMPGMVVKVSFENTSDTDSIVVPAAAVQMDSDGKYLWTVSDSCTASKRRVTLGGYSGKGVIVSDGLFSEDRIIIEGYQKVSTGMKVIITDGIED